MTSKQTTIQDDAIANADFPTCMFKKKERKEKKKLGREKKGKETHTHTHTSDQSIHILTSAHHSQN